jgi:hypothetical protein
MVFALINYALSHRPKWPDWLTATLFLLFGVFFLSLRQRSSVIALAFILCFFLWYNPTGNRRLRTTIRVLGMVLAGMTTVLAYQAVSGARFFGDFQGRFENERIVDQHNRVHDDWLAFSAVMKSPLTGTAAFDVQASALAEGGQSLGLDVHPVLAVAVLGGLPMLLLVSVATWQCVKRCRLILSRAAADDQSIAAVISLAYMFCVGILSFAGVFTLVRDMLPTLLFVGIVEASAAATTRTYAFSNQLNPQLDPAHRYVNLRDESTLGPAL